MRSLISFSPPGGNLELALTLKFTDAGGDLEQHLQLLGSPGQESDAALRRPLAQGKALDLAEDRLWPQDIVLTQRHRASPFCERG